MKPTVALPFLGLLLLQPGGRRPTFLVLLGYGLLTAWAAHFQPVGLGTLLHDWRVRTAQVSLSRGYANVSKGLAAVGLSEGTFPVALVLLLAFGSWLKRHRHADPWLLLGVTALVARLWTYHRAYDNGLILLPMVALFRMARHPEGDARAELLLGVAAFTALAPARWMRGAEPGALLLEWGYTVLWITMLRFLMDRARRESRAIATSPRDPSPLGAQLRKAPASLR